MSLTRKGRCQARLRGITEPERSVGASKDKRSRNAFAGGVKRSEAGQTRCGLGLENALARAVVLPSMAVPAAYPHLLEVPHSRFRGPTIHAFSLVGGPAFPASAFAPSHCPRFHFGCTRGIVLAFVRTDSAPAAPTRAAGTPLCPLLLHQLPLGNFP
ncbi:hypothetical protein BC826DRAFT_1104809 [Russula brevipes]|nr:hypothetical protein BC826DRAFT_1104809 [Russula brevipes]